MKKLETYVFLKTSIILLQIIVMVTLFSLLLAFPIQWCWNYTMPYLFGLKIISWSQAWCFYFLASCLLKAIQINNK